MAQMDSIEAENDCDTVVVAALRCYASARRENRRVLPDMVELAGRNGLGAPAAVALTSVFELTEACLGRRLLAREEDDAPPTTDEAAMLMLIANVGHVGSFCGSAATPHGLPGAPVWAIRCAGRLWLGSCPPTLNSSPVIVSCPFVS